MATLEQRIQRLEDIEAIRNLKARYFHACDHKDIKTVENCFADGEVHIDYGPIGQFSSREDFLAIYQQMACHDFIIDMHHGQNAQIEWIDENNAKASWDLYFHQINTQENILTQMAGFYQDEFVKQNGEWKISKTIYQASSTNMTQIKDGDIQSLFAGVQAPLPG